MGLFTPIYMKPDLNLKQQRKALEKVAAITEAEELCRIALSAPLPAVAVKAVEGLNDSGKLRRVAWEASNLAVRQAAAGKLTDVGALVSLAGGKPELFETCLRRMKALGDRQGLAQLFIGYTIRDKTQSINAINREYGRVAEKLRDIADQEIIESVARGAREAGIRARAVKLLESPEALAEIAKKDRDSGVRRAAIDNPRFTDIETLSGIAGDESLGLDARRWSAALRLTALAPDRAVRPLVMLLAKNGSQKGDRERLWTAARFLEERYRNADGEERERIASLRNGQYGLNWKGPCWHEDESVHFDIPR